MTAQAGPSMTSATPAAREGHAGVLQSSGNGSAMRLLVMFPSLARGGTEEYALRIASAARRAGWEVHGGWPDVPAMRSLVTDWKDRGMTYHPLGIPVANDSPRMLTRWHHTARCARTIALLWKVRPKVVLLALPWPTFGLGAIVACALRRVPTMVSFQLVPWPAMVIGKTLRAYQWARTRRQLWVVNSADGQRNLSGTFRIAPQDIRIIRNGVNMSEFARELSTDEREGVRGQVRAEFGLAPDARLLVTVARLHHQKGYGDLLAAARAVTREFPDVRFLWVGDGDLREPLERENRAAGLQERIVLAGFRPDLARFYRAADLFVFPTHFEGGASFALVEAMASGAPVVSSDASGIPEVVEDRVHGLLFPAKNSGALTAAIRYALNHPEEMEAMARRGRERAAELTEERMCRDTLDALAQLGRSRVP
jgi:glycosyltransferase involved in cell wall biosynthesis